MKTPDAPDIQFLVGRANKRQLRRALLEAELSLKAIGHPGELSPPDAQVCAIIAKGCLVRIANALEVKS